MFRRISRFGVSHGSRVEPGLTPKRLMGLSAMNDPNLLRQRGTNEGPTRDDALQLKNETPISNSVLREFVIHAVSIPFGTSPASLPGGSDSFEISNVEVRSCPVGSPHLKLSPAQLPTCLPVGQADKGWNQTWNQNTFSQTGFLIPQFESFV